MLSLSMENSRTRLPNMEDNDLRHQVEVLLKERNDAVKKCEELQSALERRGIKDAPTILKLQKELDEVKRNCEGQGALCTSLTEESEVLKRKLDKTVAICQELLHKLNESASNEVIPARDKPQSQVSGSERTTLQTLINHLEAELKQLVSENVRWEEDYMKQRQQIERLKGLRDTAAREMQSSAGNMRSTRQQDDEHHAQLEQLFDKYKQKLARLEQDCLQIDAENAQLKTQLERLQQQELMMQQRQQEMLVSQSASLPSTDTREKLDALRVQAQLYLDDFKSERRDREMAQSQIAELESEVQMLRMQVLDEEANHRRNQQYQQLNGRDECDDSNTPTQYRTRGAMSRDNSRDEGDGPSSPMKPVPGNSNASHCSPSKSQHNAALKCPNCDVTFAATDDLGLLKHMSECMVD